VKLLPEDRCVAVQEVGGEIHHDRQLGELLQQLPGGDGRVVARTTACPTEQDRINKCQRKYQNNKKPWIGRVYKMERLACRLNLSELLL
jgi:hypothetical protein